MKQRIFNVSLESNDVMKPYLCGTMTVTIPPRGLPDRILSIRETITKNMFHGLFAVSFGVSLVIDLNHQ